MQNSPVSVGKVLDVAVQITSKAVPVVPSDDLTSIVIVSSPGPGGKGIKILKFPRPLILH
jgi:hypothetical protein